MKLLCSCGGKSCSGPDDQYWVASHRVITLFWETYRMEAPGFNWAPLASMLMNATPGNIYSYRDENGLYSGHPTTLDSEGLYITIPAILLLPCIKFLNIDKQLDLAICSSGFLWCCSYGSLTIKASRPGRAYDIASPWKMDDTSISKRTARGLRSCSRTGWYSPDGLLKSLKPRG